MRHSASLLASMEGMSRSAFRMAKELTSNSRSGLTARFLAKKLEMPEEEIEYLLDVNPRLMFTDLTKIKIVPEGYGAVKRIAEGLENHGDIPSLFRQIKAMGAHEFRAIEEQLGITQPATKKGAAEELVAQCYKHPDSAVGYVATHGFSETAREVFDIVWQCPDGLLPVSQVRTAHGGAEFEVEQALNELVVGMALFEMFRFDAEDRLVRVVGLLSEIRQYRGSQKKSKGQKTKIKPLRVQPGLVQSSGVSFSDVICRIVATIAARPVRLRGDGDLFREDQRRLAEICAEDADPSLNTCIWVAEGAGWLSRVDDSLCAGDLEPLIELDSVHRHRILYDWFVSKGDNAGSRRLLLGVIDDLKTGAWYKTMELIHYAMQRGGESEQPIIRASGAHWEYSLPSVSGQTQNRLARALEEAFFWLGIVDRATHERESLVCLTPLGEALLRNTNPPQLSSEFPPRIGEFIVQPNFDIVVPVQDIDPLLTVPLDQFAVRGSTGQATVYNVSKESFTQAIQNGHDASAFVEFLLAHNRGGGLPKNVMATLEDWRGAMKRVQLRTIHVLESEDHLVLADLLHRRKFNKYFKHLDPKKSVCFSGVSKADITKALEKEGFIVV